MLQASTTPLLITLSRRHLDYHSIGVGECVSLTLGGVADDNTVRMIPQVHC